MSCASGGPGTPQRNWNTIPDLVRTMPMKEVKARVVLASL